MSDTPPPRRVTEPMDLRLVEAFDSLFLPLKMGSRTVRFLVDTGAPWTLVSLAQVKECGLRGSIIEVGEVGLVTVGVLEAKVEAEGGCFLNFVAIVMHRLYTPLLGMNFLLRYGCLLVLHPELPLLTVRPPRPAKIDLRCGVYKQCLLSNHLATAMLDTGSTHCFIGRGLARDFKLKRKWCWPIPVTLFDGRVTAVCRKVSQAELSIDGLHFTTDFIVHPNENVPIILGMNVLYSSTLCLEKKEILLSNANPLCVGGEQVPKPSSISLTPPQFFVLHSSGRLISSTTRKPRGFSPFSKWSKFLRRFSRFGSGRRSMHEATSGSWSDPGRTTETENGGETETRNGSDEEQGDASDK